MVAVKPSLANPYLKVRRAEEHLKTLKVEIETFRKKPDPYRVVEQIDTENSLYIARVQLSDPPDTVGMIAGDFFYCLRSALDQLVFQLARLTTKRPRDTCFPILSEDTAKTRHIFRDCTRGVPAQARDLIKTFQPYNRGHAIKDHLLWRINRMCNLDKHERIPVHSTQVPIEFHNDLPRHLVTLETLDDCGVVTIPLAFKDKMKFQPPNTISVMFGDASIGISASMEDIEAMYEYVTNRVIPAFSRFFA